MIIYNLTNCPIFLSRRDVVDTSFIEGTFEILANDVLYDNNLEEELLIEEVNFFSGQSQRPLN